MKILLLFTASIALTCNACLFSILEPSPKTRLEMFRSLTSSRNVKNIQLLSHFEMQGLNVNGITHTIIEYPNKMRTATEVIGIEKEIIVFNDSKASSASRLTGIRDCSDSEIENIKFDLELGNQNFSIDYLFESFEVLPFQKGYENHVIVLATPNKKQWKYIQPYTFYFNKKSNLLDRQDYTTVRENSLTPFSVEFIKYTNKYGFILPEETTVTQDNNKIDNFLIDVKINENFSPSLFLPPEDNF